jgi:hypothetical protein
MRRGLWFAGVVLTALTMGLEFAHVLEWPVKQGYSGEMWVRLQESLYSWFGTVGAALYVLAIVVGVALAVTRKRTPLWWAAGLQVVALATFLAVIYPVNRRLPLTSGDQVSVPPDWASLRVRWELGHTVGFALFLAAFVLLLRDRSREE